MQKAIISFVICALLGFGLGYLVFGVIMGDSEKQPQVTQTETKDSTTTKSPDSKETATSSISEDNILNKRGCLGCHSVEALNLKGGQVGPDLSQAFGNVEGKHGKPIEEFLKQPTSAVMSGVIGKNPLTDDERKQVLDLLKQASEAK
ncbi:hypothetical protein BACCIP111895_01167 [Neobacillus rhizosphaerae]|uniref:Cytochrome c domain-containing protein n=1 Tax=Neobacillus rhizosphaerae TaxID=2880965 RepID=A0ABM9EN17_9BACI|nr:cytochrome C [Neobacillus rhizosphaerae]CAH2714013.1 hypothetical protein BACCIP111895_01167 [Neobacillus rhizosphaerae]